jgi:exopolysaccharide biosynthesis WecB/TagA/CpsF family protein
MYTSTSVRSLPLYNCSRNEFVDLFLDDLAIGFNRPKLVFDLNGEALAEDFLSEEFRCMYRQADYYHADGIPIVWYSRMATGNPCKERIATTDWVNDVFEHKGARTVRHYFLGSTKKSVEGMVGYVRRTFPQVVIVGYHHGYFRQDEEKGLVRAISDAGTDLLWVGMGRYRQERFSVCWRDELKVTWIKTCGGLFDYYSGKNPRAPLILQSLGLEWFFRLCVEPRRLFVRYARTNPLVLFLLFSATVRYRIRMHSFHSN